jgi:Uma2 family endonuclease
MTTGVVTYEEYEELALNEPEHFWELHDGRLVRKPDEIMTTAHNRIGDELGYQFHLQLDRSLYQVRTNNARARRRDRSAYIPDLLIVPVALVRRNEVERPRRLEAYEEPLPLVVEIWSPSTGRYDVDDKLPEYQRRGDREIWRIHPLERTLTAWRRQPDGTYVESVYTSGSIEPVALPGVRIDIDRLFVP